MLNLSATGMNGIIISFLFSILAVNSLTQDVGYFWHVTDFHYDPTYNLTSLSCKKLGNRLGPLGNIWCDSPWALIESAVQAMQSLRPDVDFLLWTGDTVLHADVKKLSHSFNAVITDNVTDLLKNTFTDIPVYASFGNHDSYPSDQFRPRNTALYNESLSRWRDWINDTTQDAFFRKGGYYSVKTRHNIRIVALNTILYYKPNKAVQPDGDPAGQFDWLTKVLGEARRNEEKVIISAHISPGVTPNGDEDLYTHYNGVLTDVLKQFSDVIVAMHFGHEHADTLKVLKNKAGVPASSVFLAPSVTPILSRGMHNPGIRLVKYERNTGKHLDISQYYLDLHAANEAGAASWKLEYTACNAYDISDLSAASLHTLVERMGSLDSQEFKRYRNYYFVNPPEEFTEECDKECHRSIVCGFTEFGKADFDDCVAKLTSSAEQLTAWTLILGFSIMFLII